VRPPSRYGLPRTVTVNGKPWTRFTADEVELGELKGKTDVVCRYR
jgi:hypothetical protein